MDLGPGGEQWGAGLCLQSEQGSSKTQTLPKLAPMGGKRLGIPTNGRRLTQNSGQSEEAWFEGRAIGCGLARGLHQSEERRLESWPTGKDLLRICTNRRRPALNANQWGWGLEFPPIACGLALKPGQLPKRLSWSFHQSEETWTELTNGSLAFPWTLRNLDQWEQTSGMHQSEETGIELANGGRPWRAPWPSPHQWGVWSLSERAAKNLVAVWPFPACFVPCGQGSGGRG